MSDPFVFDHKRLFNEPTMEQHGSHMIIKNVHKPEKTKYLTIDTRFRDQYDTSLLANYNITLPERVNSVKSMKALQLEMPLSYHNVSASLGNNSFQLTSTANTDVITLDDKVSPILALLLLKPLNLPANYVLNLIIYITNPSNNIGY